jgi:ABC-2 type transport system permease protein
MNRIQTIIDKEWAEVFKNRMVLFTVSFLPLIFTALPLVIIYAANSGSDMMGDMPDSADLPPQFLRLCGAISAGACVQIFLVNQFMILFMLMPLIIPISIAAYSIVGEKSTRSLEPLLATPITTRELLIGKSLAAIIPAVLATWGGFLIFVIGAPLVGAQPPVIKYLLSPTWLLAILVAGPLMSIVAVTFAIMVSSRVNDPRAAEQLAAVVVVPLLAMVFGQLAGVITLNLQFMLTAIAVIVVADIGLIYLAVRVFQREAILTRWK